MKTGIDQISFYTSQYFLDLKTLAEARGADPEKFYTGIGQEKMGIPPPDEDVVTMAASAAFRLKEQGALEGVEAFLTVAKRQALWRKRKAQQDGAAGDPSPGNTDRAEPHEHLAVKQGVGNTDEQGKGQHDQELAAKIAGRQIPQADHGGREQKKRQQRRYLISSEGHDSANEDKNRQHFCPRI